MRHPMSEANMPNMISAFVLTASLGFASVSTVLAAPAGSSGAFRFGELHNAVEQVQYWGGNRCERLRRACVNKDERGERGEGNCRRYREECGSAESYCERLRRACFYKEERGERGEGNCRRYRSECGGRR